jgi:MFS family permease
VPVLERFAPARLGTGFRWLLASGWVSNLGDGIALAAGPLLVASQTDQEFLVALAALLQWLPPFAFGLFAGALADRLDRKLIVITVDVLRSLVLALLAVSVLTDSVSIWLVLVRCSCSAPPNSSWTTP